MALTQTTHHPRAQVASRPSRPADAVPGVGRTHRGRWLDPVMVFVVSLVVYSSHGFEGLLNRDFGLFVYGGERVADGVPPYRDVFNSVGPLSDALPGLGIGLGRLIDADPVLSARLLFLVLAASCCAALCVLARDTFGNRAAGLVAPAVFLLFRDFSALAANGPREKTAMLLFLLVALVLLGRRRWAAAGVFTALATLTWQPALVVAVVSALAAAGRPGRRAWWGALVGFIGGGTVTTAVAVAYFAGAQGLRQAVDGFVVVNLLYTHQPSVMTSAGVTWRMLWNSYGPSLLLALGGLVALLAVTVLGRSNRHVVLVGSGALAAVGWTMLVINGGPDLFVVLPFSALGVTGATLAVARRLPTGASTALVAAVVATAVGTATAVAVSTRDTTLVVERADVEAVLATQPPTATVMSVGVPEVLAIAQRTNPTSYQLFDHRMLSYLNDHWPGGLTGFTAEMSRVRPTFLVVSSAEGRWLQPLLDRYARVGRSVKWTWYVRRSVGHVAIERARAANKGVMADHRGKSWHVR